MPRKEEKSALRCLDLDDRITKSKCVPSVSCFPENPEVKLERKRAGGEGEQGEGGESREGGEKGVDAQSQHLEKQDKKS